MILVLNKQSTLVINEEWNLMSPEVEQIVTHTLVVDKLKDNNLNISEAIVKAGRWGWTDKTPKVLKNPKSCTSRLNRYPKNNKSYLYAWNKVPPASVEKHTGNSMGDKSYNWCMDHVSWCVPTASYCTIKK